MKVWTLTDAASKAGYSIEVVRTAILSAGIPTTKIGASQVLDEEGMSQLEATLSRIHSEARSRGMRFAKAAALA